MKENLVLGLIIFSTFYIGYSDYGMNHTRAEKILNTINQSEFVGLKAIFFNTQQCVSYYNFVCNPANFKYLGKHTAITIGNFNSESDENIYYYLYHELMHLKQYLNGSIKGIKNGFNDEIENEANDYAVFKVKELGYI